MSGNLQKLTKHGLHYFAAQFIVMLGGLITFPLLTRALPKAEYGLIAIINTTLGVLIAISKFGMQNASVRLYPEAKNLGPYAEAELNSTVFFSVLTVATLLGLSFFLISEIAGFGHDHPHFVMVSMFAASLLVVQSLNVILVNFLRARQESLTVSSLQVLNKVSATLLLFASIFLIRRDAQGFYAALLISELLFLVVLITYSGKTFCLSLSSYSTSIFRRAASFGIPLVGFELVTELLAYGDRFLIKYYLGWEALAVYAAGYNLADYVRNLLLYPIAFAVLPIISDTWENSGKEATRELVSKSLRQYWYLLVPAVFGIVFLSEDIMRLLASEKYSASHEIVPYVVVSATLYGTFPLTGAGIYLQDKTGILFFLVLFTLCLNFGLNLFLIPRHGIIGAAESTFAAYIILFLLIVFTSRKYLAVKILDFAVIKSILYSTVMVASLWLIKRNFHALAGTEFLWVPFAMVFGACVYLLVLILFEPEFRGRVFALARQCVAAPGLKSG